MVIYISENNNTRVVKPTEGRRGPQMSGPPLAPAASTRLQLLLLDSGRDKDNREWLSRSQGEIQTIALLCKICLPLVFFNKKNMCNMQQDGKNNRKFQSEELCNQQNAKRFALSKDVHYCAPNTKVVQMCLHGRQAVIHLPSGFSIYRLLVSKERGKGAFQKL